MADENPIPESYRFIAYSLLSEFRVARGLSARDCYQRAMAAERAPGERYLEIVDCSHHGCDVWASTVPLSAIRRTYPTVFRGAGMMPHLMPVALGAPTTGQSILERDIDFYGGECDRLQTELRRCNVFQEAVIKRQIEAARGVVAALLVYQLRLKGE